MSALTHLSDTFQDAPLIMNLLKSLAAVSSMTLFSRVLGFARDAIVRAFSGWHGHRCLSWRLNCPICCDVFLPKAPFRRRSYRFLPNTKASRAKTPRGVCCLCIRPADAGAGGSDGAGHGRSSWVIVVTAPGFADTADKFTLTSSLLRVTFPYILLISLASLAGAILNTEPLLRPGVRAHAAEYQHDRLCAVCRAALPSAGDGAGVGSGRGRLLQLFYQLPHLKRLACWYCRASTCAMPACGG